MLTAGEIITSVGRFYLNQSQGDQAKQPSVRARIGFFLREAMVRAWTVAPLNQRHINGTVSIATTGIGTFPTDFAGIGPTTTAFLTTGGTLPLTYMPEQELLARATQYPDGGQPLFWTRIRQVAASGLAQMQVWPPPLQTSSVMVNSYNRRCLDPIDFPGKPTVATGATGNLTGTFKWKAAYEWPDGSTEGGYESESLTPAAKQVTVTIPTAWSRLVTTVTVYRTANGGSIFKKSGSVAVSGATIITSGGQQCVQYTDDVTDTDLGVNCPIPAEAITGIEQFPLDFIETTLFEGTKALAMTSQGDMRDAAFWGAFLKECRRMWADQKPGQGQGRQLIQYALTRSGPVTPDVRYRYRG